MYYIPTARDNQGDRPFFAGRINERAPGIWTRTGIIAGGRAPGRGRGCGTRARARARGHGHRRGRGRRRECGRRRERGAQAQARAQAWAWARARARARARTLGAGVGRGRRARSAGAGTGREHRRGRVNESPNAKRPQYKWRGDRKKGCISAPAPKRCGWEYSIQNTFLENPASFAFSITDGRAGLHDVFMKFP